jgi:hypothetical protein
MIAHSEAEQATPRRAPSRGVFLDLPFLQASIEASNKHHEEAAAASPSQSPRFRLESRCSRRRRVVVAVVFRGGGDLGGAASLGKIPKSTLSRFVLSSAPPTNRTIEMKKCPTHLILHTRSPLHHPKSISPFGFRAKPPRRRAKKKSLRTRKTRENSAL